MCNSNTVVSVVVGAIFLAIALASTLPLILQTDKGLDLIVYCEAGKSVVDSPRPDEFEIPDELWEDPKYKSERVEFSEGVIEIKEAGVYHLNSLTSFFIENESEDLVLGNAFARIIQGNITNRFKYTTKEVLSIDASTVAVPEYDPNYPAVKPHSHYTLANSVDFEITEEDISNGDNNIAPQYVFNHFTYDDADLYKDINVGRDTHTVKTFLSLSKVQGKINTPEIKL